MHLSKSCPSLLCQVRAVVLVAQNGKKQLSRIFRPAAPLMTSPKAASTTQQDGGPPGPSGDGGNSPPPVESSLQPSLAICDDHLDVCWPFQVEVQNSHPNEANSLSAFSHCAMVQVWDTSGWHAEFLSPCWNHAYPGAAESWAQCIATYSPGLPPLRAITR